jgi:NAD(P)-dependent dehydrogenase (short-subunit alcohol dehydrogenase family)
MEENTKMDEFSLKGKVAVITGASRGIGRAIAELYAQAGAKMVVSSRKLPNVQEVADGIQAAGGQALALQAHIGRTEDMQGMVTKTVEHFGRLDILVNNAAINPHFGPLLAADEGQWDKIMDTNVKGVFRACQAAAPMMQAQRSGKIINIISVSGLQPMPGLGLYGITKAAVLMLTKVLAMELGWANIQVNAIAPGVIKTRFSQVLWDSPQISEHILGRLPLGRFGEANEVAQMALFLAAPASDYVSGSVFLVDGGMSIGFGP